MIHHDWLMGALGGLMIGGAGALLLLVNGRILGASGILGDLIDGSGRRGAGERLAFLAGTFLVPLALAMLTGGGSTHLTPNLWVVVPAGLLVGSGSRLANGCTSGHGVCGISRLSPRGIVATALYLVAGGVTVYVFRHLLDLI